MVFVFACEMLHAVLITFSELLPLPWCMHAMNSFDTERSVLLCTFLAVFLTPILMWFVRERCANVWQFTFVVNALAGQRYCPTSVCRPCSTHVVQCYKVLMTKTTLLGSAYLHTVKSAKDDLPGGPCQCGIHRWINASLHSYQLSQYLISSFTYDLC